MTTTEKIWFCKQGIFWFGQGAKFVTELFGSQRMVVVVATRAKHIELVCHCGLEKDIWDGLLLTVAILHSNFESLWILFFTVNTENSHTHTHSLLHGSLCKKLGKLWSQVLDSDLMSFMYKCYWNKLIQSKMRISAKEAMHIFTLQQDVTNERRNRDIIHTIWFPICFPGELIMTRNITL